jgi:hypothetical protein
VVISISIIISLILGGFDYLFTNSIGLIGNFKNQSPTTTIEQSVTPSIIAIPTVASTAGKATQK